jgi:hypothetical protein
VGGIWGGVGVGVCIGYGYGGVIFSVRYTYFGGIFPYIGEFHFIVYEIGLNGVDVYMCVSYLL